MSNPVAEYERLLRLQHALIGAGEGESEYAATLADRMDAPWYAMADSERERMSRLSAELYGLQGDSGA